VDVCGPLTVASRSRRGRAVGLVIIVIVFASLTGCYSPESGTIISTIPPSFNQLKDRIAQLRQLSLKHDITLALNGFDASAEDLDGPPGKNDGLSSVKQLERAYQKIGLLEERTNLAGALADYHRIEQMALYHGTTRTVSLGPEAFRLGQVFARANPRRAREIPALFGIVEALQDQNFHWNERLRTVFSEDRRLAFQSLAKGDATLVALAHGSGEEKVPTSVVDLQIIARLGAELERSAPDLPPLLRHKLTFPYREGSQFVLWAYAAKGWQGVNGLYAYPPLSTSQILHPERYYLTRENPLHIFPWGLIARLRESAVLEQTLGESVVRLLLASTRSGQEAAEIASAWRGDQLSVYAKDGKAVTAWISSWKSDATARNFFRVYQEALAKHRRMRLEPTPTEKDSLQAESTDGRALVLQLKGPVVLFLDGLPFAQSLEIAAAAWRDLEMDTEPTRAPLDLGRRPLQLSRTSK